MAVYELFVNQFLPFIQSETTSNPQGFAVSQYLAFTQTATDWRIFVSARSNLSFGHEATVRKSINNIGVTQFLEFHQGGHKFNSLQDVQQYLAYGHIARVVEYEIVSQTLALTQEAEVTVAKPGFDTLTFTQSVEVNVIRGLQVTQTLVISQGGVFFLANRDEDQYAITLPTLTGPNAPECT